MLHPRRGKKNFYPRPPRGGRRRGQRAQGVNHGISIHALREEGDDQQAEIDSYLEDFYPRPPRGGRPKTSKSEQSKSGFLSTPSARRATRLLHQRTTESAISIHALREEGDSITFSRRTAFCDFYPRPPRGGRPENFPHGGRSCWISIHALREEGDHEQYLAADQEAIFLSTPSARRATAKTETKSLFSNKLYNILHEFRRALIYNGSKSYPNHAK